MNENTSWALQKSIYSALNSAPEIISRLGNDRIYDDVPRSAVYPYVSFGQSSVQPLSGSDGHGVVHSIELHVWSKERGKKEVFAIMSMIQHLLDVQPLVLSGQSLVNSACEFSQVRRDPKTQSYHGVMRYRIVTELVA